MKWFIPCFLFPFVGIGLINSFKSEGQKRKYAVLVVIILLLLSVSFSAFYQHWRTKGGGVHLFNNYMKDSTYTAGLWTKENIDGPVVSNNVVFGIRLFSTSGVPLMTGYYNTVDLAYGFANISELTLIKKPITSDSYWYDGPYSVIGGYSSRTYWNDIMGNSYGYYESRYRSKFNFTHFIEKKGYHVEPLRYIHEHKYYIYDNGDIYIWPIYE